MSDDFVVLDRDLTKVSPPEILKTVVLRTVVEGKTVLPTRKMNPPKATRQNEGRKYLPALRIVKSFA